MKGMENIKISIPSRQNASINPSSGVHKIVLDSARQSTNLSSGDSNRNNGTPTYTSPSIKLMKMEDMNKQ